MNEHTILTANLSPEQLVAWDRDVDCDGVQGLGIYSYEPQEVWIRYDSQTTDSVSYIWLAPEVRWLRREQSACACDAGRRWENRDYQGPPYPEHMDYCGCSVPISRGEEIEEWERQREEHYQDSSYWRLAYGSLTPP